MNVQCEQFISTPDPPLCTQTHSLSGGPTIVERGHGV